MTVDRERVLITGGGAGIGAAIAQRCAQEGYEPVVIDRDGDGIRADLGDPESTARALEQALADGPITRIVNNVGAVFAASAQEQTLDQFDAAWRLNLAAAVQCTQALLPGMIEQGFGRIVSVSSRAALGKADRSAYAATKAGLIGLSRVWALELGRHGITANVVAPGPIATELFRRANPADSPRTQAILRGIPVGRMGEAVDVAHCAAHFLDRRSGFVTGQVLYVCGGMTVGVAPV
ncbi:SDR family NAD(P)-dependent oxidoreductase [Nocardia higoensis]|uniref:SDR family NAD(P)-dependent oxidoreductase n=1 Tax=Nocardia higoensis TaxID=228599 RepID=UPI000317D1B9|nr:SDR family oxidoreductase [Nocardia higoensis]